MNEIGVYREMTLGPQRIIENIYWDMENLEVRFIVACGSGLYVSTYICF
jgi:hypothetical protein